MQTLVDLYAKASHNIGGEKKYTCSYTFETEDVHEKIFEDKLRLNPNSLKYIISAIYRVKHNEGEYYFYNMTRTAKNKLGNPERFSFDGYGHFRAPVISLRWDNEKGTSTPQVTAYEHYFDLKWDPKEVKKLLESSTVACNNFYIGISGFSASDPVSNPCYKIQNSNDFLDGKFDDLMNLGRLGLSYPEKSLYLVEPALKQERQNIEKNVGLRDKQGLYA